MSVRPLPIGRDEFARMFRKCVPPVGWANNIGTSGPEFVSLNHTDLLEEGVANSGGPDSTCLLFLLHRYLSDASHTTSPAPPRTVVSLTVDHDLQPSSSAMAEHCSKFAQSLGLQHITSKIPWSRPPYPPRPIDGQPFEHVARSARFLSLFESMTQTDVRVIAFGHHADDQVETSLMRLSLGSTASGASGMRPCRRWGMGVDQKELAVYGFEGMNQWIIRPMLEVAKDRILATCEANDLEFVTDTTNFQPSVTLRNAIRHELRPNKEETAEVYQVPEIVERLNYLKQAATSMKDVSFSLNSFPETLRNAVSVLSSNSRDIDDQVDSVLKQCSLPTIPGTFLISHRGINQISDMHVRRALVLRIIRYASFYPWGSVVADAGRRKRNLDRIIQELWEWPLHEDTIFRSFTAGGGVLWTPVILKHNFIKTPESFTFGNLKYGENLAWLASRLPSMHRDKLKDRGIPNTLEIDITKAIAKGWEHWKSGGSSVVPFLYDCRYVLRFDLERMPPALAARILAPGSEEKLRVYSKTRWFWPNVVVEGNDSSEVIHNKITEKTANIFLDVDVQAGPRYYLRAPPPSVDSGWITTEWIRPLTVI